LETHKTGISGASGIRSSLLLPQLPDKINRAVAGIVFLAVAAPAAVSSVRARTDGRNVTGLKYFWCKYYKIVLRLNTLAPPVAVTGRLTMGVVLAHLLL
jgi:hypothetical protein